MNERETDRDRKHVLEQVSVRKYKIARLGAQLMYLYTPGLIDTRKQTYKNIQPHTHHSAALCIYIHKKHTEMYRHTCLYACV